MATPEEIRAQLDEEVKRLSSHSATSTDECTVATMIAVSDEEVRELIIHKAQHNVFRGVRCLSRSSVLFRFECPPGMICLIPPSFLVRVDFRTRRVVEIIDPVDPEAPPAFHAAAQAHLASEAMLVSAVNQPTRKITVTITNVVDRSIDIDGKHFQFAPGSTSVQAFVTPGTHSLDWFVQSEPGTEFTLTVTGAAEPISFTATVSDAQRENGRFSFTVA